MSCQRINKKTAMECALCHSHWTTGTLHRTQPHQQIFQDSTWEAWETEDKTWNRQRAQSRSQSRSYSPRSRTKGKGGKNQAKGKKTRGGEGKNPALDKPAPSPFAPLAAEMPPWPAQEGVTSSLLPALPTAPTAPTGVPNQEVATMLRSAYSETNPMPQEVKEYIEKLEKETAKTVTKTLHSATTAMGKAQKTLAETLDAKKQHKARWTAHITEAIKTWQSQLQDYRKQQNTLQEVVNKAKADIEQYKTSIQQLTTTVPGASLAAMPSMPTATEVEDSDADNQEERLQLQLQTVLRSCAESLGLDLPTAPEALDSMTDLTKDAEEEENARKRPRSLEPFGGSRQVGSLQDAKMS